MFPELTRDDVFRLETRRLWLRWPRAADVPAIVRLAGDKAVADMTTSLPHPYAAPDGERFVLASRQANAEGRQLTMAVSRRAEPAGLIGMVSLEPGPAGTIELGYWIGPPSWGEGFATEAARAIVDAYFSYASGRELAAEVRVINAPSRRVLEKCGFTASGSRLKPFPARGGVFPVDTFRLERRTWESFKAWSATGFVPQARHEEGCRPA